MGAQTFIIIRDGDEKERMPGKAAIERRKAFVPHKKRVRRSERDRRNKKDRRQLLRIK